MRLYVDAYRLDRVESTPGGGLKIQATPTRAGVLTYRRADGTTVRELRHPDDVFRAESLASLAGRPVTDLHPAEGQVRADNWRDLAVGHVSDTIGRDADRVSTCVYINDAAMVAAISEGKRKELSAGYYADTVDEPGVYEGQAYDRRQTNIIYNHVGLGPEGWGRAGPECALRIDAAHAHAPDLDILVGVPESETTMPLKIDGKDHEAATAQPAIDALAAARDTATAKADVATAAATKANARADAAEAKLAEATAPAKIAALVKERVTLLADIQRGNDHYLDAEDAPADAGADPIALMTEALTKWNPSLDLSGKSPEYIMGAFAAMLADVVGDTPEAPVDAVMPVDAKATPPGNTPPEMELNGTTRAPPRRKRADARDPSVTARDYLRTGKIEHDASGYPRTDGEDQDNRTLNIAANAARASAPLAVTK